MPAESDWSGNGGALKAPILVVDDHEESLMAAKVVLEPLAEELILARSGEEALKLLLARDFAVVILDVRLGGMSGFETAELVRRRERSAHTPILFVTAFYQDEEDMARAYKLGAVDYIFKPIFPEVLRAKVAVFARLYKLASTARRQGQLLERKAEELERSNEQLREFAYLASHDLRSPLRRIAGFAELLEERSADKLDEEGRECIERITAGVRRMDEMVEGVLKLALTATPGEPERLTDLEDALRTVLSELEPSLQHAGATVTHDPLPSVTAVPEHMRSVLRNLIENAVKFHGDAPPQVHVSVSRRKGEWVLGVQDNGIGIAPEVAGRLFTPFRRLHPPGRYPGIGLGLALCRRIAERHGGRVWVQSAPGRGSLFCLALPARDERPAGRAGDAKSP